MSLICHQCQAPIERAADGWPDGRDDAGVDRLLCQECWERESDASWWEMVAALNEVGFFDEEWPAEHDEEFVS